MDPIQFRNIKAPSDLTVWYTDDSKDDHSLVGWLEDALPQGVKFELAHHPEELRQKLHAKVTDNTFTKHNFFITDGVMEFSQTDWPTKPIATNVSDHYEGSFDVIRAYGPELRGKGGHYFTALYSSAFADNPASIDGSTSPDDFKLNLPDSSLYAQADFKKAPAGIMTTRKSEDPTERFVSMIQHFDKLIGLAA